MTIEVDNRALETVRADNRELNGGLLGRSVSGASKTSGEGQSVVHLHTSPVVRDLPPRVAGGHDGELASEMRGDLQKSGSLMQGIEDEVELSRIELLDGLLEVADTSVDELGGTAGRGRGKVVALCCGLCPGHQKKPKRKKKTGRGEEG